MQGSPAGERELRGEEAPSPKTTSAIGLWPSLRDTAGAPVARGRGKQEEQGLGATTAPQLGLLPSLLITSIHASSPVGDGAILAALRSTRVLGSCRAPGPWHHSARRDINCDFYTRRLFC